MSRTRTLVLAMPAIAVALVGWSGAAQQPQPAGPAPINWATIPIPNLANRLSMLAPGDPMAYFKLGEEVAAEAFDRPSRDLARTLLVLAMHLDRTSGGKLRLTSSSCLALATLTPRESERRWLIAMAQVAHASEPDGRPARRLMVAPNVSESAAFDLATAMGLIRAGDGRRAEQLLAKPAVAELLNAYENVLNDEGIVGGAQRLQRLASEWGQCSECKNRRFVTRGEGGKPRLCPTCGGSPGPQLSKQELLVHLRMESALLRGIHRLWSAQSLADGGEPLRDPDPAELSAWYKVDTERTVWQQDQWVKP